MTSKHRILIPLFLTALAATLAVAPAAAAEPGAATWPQCGGPARDFTAPAAELAATWPAEGPKQLWRRELGDDGYSGIVADGGRLYTMARRGDDEVVMAIDAATGETVWEYAEAVPLDAEAMRLDYGPGPMSTPAIAGGRLITVGALVDVRAFDLETGELAWSRDLMEEMGAPLMRRGYGASPLVWRELIILTPGCEASPETDAGEEPRGGAVIALEQGSGELAWQSQVCFGASYSSPILAEVDGEEQLMVAMGVDRAGFDPATGELRWHLALGEDATTTMSTQLWGDDQILFGSSAYADGSRGIRVAKQDDGLFAAEEIWYSRKMRVQHATAVRIGDHVYGSSGDFGPAFLAAVEVATGKLAFRQRGFAKANLLAAGDKVILLDEDGDLALGTPSPEGIEIHARVKVLDRLAWTVPTLIGTRLYVRDRHQMKAFELGP